MRKYFILFYLRLVGYSYIYSHNHRSQPLQLQSMRLKQQTKPTLIKKNRVQEQKLMRCNFLTKKKTMKNKWMHLPMFSFCFGFSTTKINEILNKSQILLLYRKSCETFNVRSNFQTKRFPFHPRHFYTKLFPQNPLVII